MGRHKRPHLPGVPFHLTARLQGKAPLFLGAEHAVAAAIRRAAANTDGELLSLAVMPNHLHVVFVQGTLPLNRLMQPLLRRLAIHIQARTRAEGHVFERRFYSKPCTDADYLRSAIAYVHLNAVRAGMCESPNDYAWTSHGEYCELTKETAQRHAGAVSGLRLFDVEPNAPLEASIASYRRFLDWRVRMDAYLQANALGLIALVPRCPDMPAGDEYWRSRFGWRCAVGMEGEQPRHRREDLRDLAIQTIRGFAPDMPLDLLRSGKRGRALVAVRREFIRRAKESGHRSRTIARFLRVSDTTVCTT